MALKTYKPTTPGQRQLVLVDRSGLYKGAPVKTLVEGQNSSGGRNNLGRITTRFRGGGHKQAYRKIDFKRAKLDAPGKVERIEYDPNRTAFIALISYADGEQAYILAPQRLAVGDTIVAGESVDIKPGNAMPVGSMPVGTIIHNVELKIGKGGQIARSAGAGVQVVAKEGHYASLKMPSGEIRLISLECLATIGQVGNLEHEKISIGKAGRSRHRGIRPISRGVARNPVDHPNGGGAGKSKSGGGWQQLTSPWGLIAKGYRTRRKTKESNRFIVVRRDGRPMKQS